MNEPSSKVKLDLPHFRVIKSHLETSPNLCSTIEMKNAKHYQRSLMQALKKCCIHLILILVTSLVSLHIQNSMKIANLHIIKICIIKTQFEQTRKNSMETKNFLYEYYSFCRSFPWEMSLEFEVSSPYCVSLSHP
ncbi:hypothetical protein Glove_718g50 [Diversispora epigaea]|uniref:Uncharacterized protein n=1 Tax=Diversispora epigaea TaxID=1348612 RepID=A0A397G0N9_9GLOM|nr:hypothetical protein Glove_718g50 [Diversispora epigaea]